MSRPRPVWWLDLDGVVNATPAPSRRMRDQFEHHEVTVNDGGRGIVVGLPLWWRPRVVDFINDVHRRELAEVRWLTTWGDQARTIFAPTVGLDDLPVLATRPDGPGADPTDDPWWKVTAIRDLHDGGDRLIFTDDDISRRVREQLRTLTGAALLITPMPSPGLTDDHIEKIRAYLTS